MGRWSRPEQAEQASEDKEQKEKARDDAIRQHQLMERLLGEIACSAANACNPRVGGIVIDIDDLFRRQIRNAVEIYRIKRDHRPGCLSGREFELDQLIRMKEFNRLTICVVAHSTAENFIDYRNTSDPRVCGPRLAGSGFRARSYAIQDE